MKEPVIETPRDLYEVKRYQDPARGDIIEMIPLDALYVPLYLGEVIVNRTQKIQFKLPGVNLTEALAAWEPTLRRVLTDLADKARTANAPQIVIAHAQ